MNNQILKYCCMYPAWNQNNNLYVFFLSHSYFVLRMYCFLVLGAFIVASGYWPPQFK